MVRTGNEYVCRFLARVVIEALTPIAVGTGVKEIMTDAPVVKDINGLPYIPGTAITGVFRHICNEIYNNDQSIDSLFGFHSNKETEGSLISFTDGIMIGEDGIPVDGITDVPNTLFYDSMLNLPLRNRVCITDKGVTKKSAKFDNEIVYAGTRFCFDIEMSAKTKSDFDKFKRLLIVMYNKGFRLGGNTRNGLGEIKVVDCKVADLDLTDCADMHEYLYKSSSLKGNLSPAFKDLILSSSDASLNNNKNWIEYVLNIKPDDFFFFGSGFGDAASVADMTPVREDKIIWSNEKPQRPRIESLFVLIPGASVKGAISHRVAYHYNLLMRRFASSDTTAKVGTDNEAVMALFGFHDNDNLQMKRGNVIVSDIFLENNQSHKEKLFNHVSIDYFTGGAIDGALFTDRVDMDERNFLLNISVRKEALEDVNVKKAFEMTLEDLCNGLLPLGGSVNRGYGCFSGTVTLKEYSNE